MTAGLLFRSFCVPNDVSLVPVTNNILRFTLKRKNRMGLFMTHFLIYFRAQATVKVSLCRSFRWTTECISFTTLQFETLQSRLLDLLCECGCVQPIEVCNFLNKEHETA